MAQIIVPCDTCENTYFGEWFDSEEKKGQYGKYRVETYQAQCTTCDKPIFTTNNVNL